MAMVSGSASNPVASAAERRILLVGASRGLGLGLAKSFAAHGWAVVATERRASDSGGLAAAVAAAGGYIRAELVDINDPQAVKNLRAQLSGERFDVIFIVAGIRDKDPTRPTHEVSVEEAVHVFVSNAYSPICFAETFFDLLKPDGTLAIMTSRMASLTLVSTAADGTWELYRASKAALNMLTRCFHERHRNSGRTVLLMHPGWVKTDMGGEDAPVDLTTSVEGLYSTLINWHGSGKQAFLDYQGNELPW
jgi:NAD(P)-dependent dehydrogenase (short-subunit alcohol dehydrogenase family)